MVQAKTVENNTLTLGAALRGAMQGEANQILLASGLGWTAVWGGKLIGLATTSPGDQPKTPPTQAKRSPDPLFPLKTTDVPFFLAHVPSVDDDNEGSDSFCKYLPIRINNYTCSSLVDSGNIWRNAISKDFAFNQIKLTEADIRPLSTKTIGTAKDGASMSVGRGHSTSAPTVGRDIHLPENKASHTRRPFDAI
jgi:hypothetical protein